MKVRFYGRLADVMGSQLEIDVPQGCSVADLRSRLAADHPEAEAVLNSGRTRGCVGDEIVHDDHVLASQDLVEFLPPVSGG